MDGSALQYILPMNKSRENKSGKLNVMRQLGINLCVKPAISLFVLKKWNGLTQKAKHWVCNKGHNPFVSLQDCPSANLSQKEESLDHMTVQLLVLSLLKEELKNSLLLGRCRSRFRWAGLGLTGGWRQASAAERKTLWMLFSDVNAEHSRYASAPTCFASEDP